MPGPHRLDPLIRPRSIAIVGASDRVGQPGNEALVNLRKGHFKGAIYPVNPGRETAGGIACHPSLRSLPEVPDLVVFTVADQRLEACLDEAIALGVPAAAVFSALQLEDDGKPSLVYSVEIDNADPHTFQLLELQGYPKREDDEDGKEQWALYFVDESFDSVLQLVDSALLTIQRD